MQIAKHLMSVVFTTVVILFFNLLIRAGSEFLNLFHNDGQAEKSCAPVKFFKEIKNGF